MALLAPPFPKSALLRRASLTKQPCQHSPSPTRAGERNLLTTAFSEPRLDSRHCVVLTAIFLPGHHRCYFRLRLLALPQPLAFRLALCGHLSRLATRSTRTIIFRRPSATHCRCCFQRLFRITPASATWQISYAVSVRSQPAPEPVTTAYRKYLGCILEQLPKDLPTLHL